MDKLKTRADIDEFLRPRRGQRPSDLPALTMDALKATLKGLAAGEIRCDYAIRYAATAMGYLLADCPVQAAWAARQAVASYALPPATRQASATELLAGVAQLRLLRRDVSK